MRGKRDVRTHLVSPALLVLAVVAGILAGCGPEGNEGEAPPDTAAAEETVPERTIQQVMGEYSGRWMDRPEVIGTGIGRCDEEPCIVVYLTRELSEDDEPLPERVEGYRVRTEVTGRVTPRDVDSTE